MVFFVLSIWFTSRSTAIFVLFISSFFFFFSSLYLKSSVFFLIITILQNKIAFCWSNLKLALHYLKFFCCSVYMNANYWKQNKFTMSESSSIAWSSSSSSSSSSKSSSFSLWSCPCSISRTWLAASVTFSVSIQQQMSFYHCLEFYLHETIYTFVIGLITFALGCPGGSHDTRLVLVHQ